MQEKLNLLELFAGSRSIGKVAEKRGLNVFSVDWERYDKINLVKDIQDLTIEDIPFVPDIIWASFDCTTYSIAACSTHRNIDRSPKTDYAKKSDAINQHVLKLTGKWLKMNPKMVFFFENPRGILRKMDFMRNIPRKTVTYCSYGDDRMKPTDIWTNSKTWNPKPLCHNFKYDKNGNVIDPHCHHESARRGAKTGTQGRKGSYERSIIPENLCIEIIESLF